MALEKKFEIRPSTHSYSREFEIVDEHGRFIAKCQSEFIAAIIKDALEKMFK